MFVKCMKNSTSHFTYDAILSLSVYLPGVSYPMSIVSLSVCGCASGCRYVRGRASVGMTKPIAIKRKASTILISACSIRYKTKSYVLLKTTKFVIKSERTRDKNKLGYVSLTKEASRNVTRNG